MILVALVVVALIDNFVLYPLFRRAGVMWAYHALVCVLQSYLFVTVSSWLRYACLIMAIIHAYAVRDEWRNRKNKRGRATRLLGYKGRALRAKLLAALPRPTRQAWGGARL